jgi:hypothetical protein
MPASESELAFISTTTRMSILLLCLPNVWSSSEIAARCGVFLPPLPLRRTEIDKIDNGFQ